MSVRTAVTTLILAGVSYVEASAAIGYTNVSVSAVTSSPAIEVSVVSGAPDVSFVEPTFTAIYMQPEYVARYLDIDVLAVPSKPAVIQVDVVNPLDNTVFGVGKNVSELVTTSDSNVVSFAGKLEDQVYLAETFVPLRFITRLFTDTYSLVDASAIGFGASYTDSVITSEQLNTIDVDKVLQDTVVNLDTTAATLEKVLSDSVNSTDAYTVDTLKVFADSTSSADIFSRTVDFARIFSSSVTLVELATNSVGKTLTDTTTATEYYLVDFSSVQQDSVGATDNTSVLNQFFRAFSDTATPADDKAAIFGKVLSDLVTMQDSALAAVQYNTSFSDSVSLTDTAIPVLPIVRTFADSFTMNEYVSKLNEAPLNSFVVGGKYGGETVLVTMDRFVPPFSDSTGTADSGTWLLQDYTSADYFAEDYVGTKGTI